MVRQAFAADRQSWEHFSHDSSFPIGISRRTSAGQAGIVTGAGSGIGRCTAHELAALGARVALVGRRIEKLEAVAREIADVGGSANVYAADIREEERVREVVRSALADFGRLDFLVNNAGGQFFAPLETISAKGFDSVVKTNLNGGFLMAREAYMQWMKGRGGAIVNMIADMWSGMPLLGHSGAARAGMLNLTETAALEWAPVRVNAVAPGWIASSGPRAVSGRTARALQGTAAQGAARPARHGVRGVGCNRLPAVTGGGFISGSCIRIDGAVPNVKYSYPVPQREPTVAFNGFHLAAKPRRPNNPVWDCCGPVDAKPVGIRYHACELMPRMPTGR